MKIELYNYLNTGSINPGTAILRIEGDEIVVGSLYEELISRIKKEKNE